MGGGVVVVVNREESLCTCVEGNNVGLLCIEHGEIPGQNSMVVGRFMGPSCVRLRDVLWGWGRLG